MRNWPLALYANCLSRELWQGQAGDTASTTAVDDRHARQARARPHARRPTTLRLYQRPCRGNGWLPVGIPSNLVPWAPKNNVSCKYHAKYRRKRSRPGNGWKAVFCGQLAKNPTLSANGNPLFPNCSASG